VRFTGISARGISGTVVLAEINFQAVGGDGDGSTLTLTVDPITDATGQRLRVNRQNGWVHVGEEAIRDIHLYLPLIQKLHQPASPD
jgi:hypothetical protein